MEVVLHYYILKCIIIIIYIRINIIIRQHDIYRRI